MIADKNIRSACYAAMEETLKERQLHPERCYYPVTEDGSLDTDDVAYYDVATPKGRLYLAPVNWDVSDENLGALIHQAQEVIDKNGRPLYQFVLSGQGWTPERVDQFRSSIQVNPILEQFAASTLAEFTGASV